MKDYLDIEKLSGLLMDYAPKVLGAIITLIIGFWLAGIITKWVKNAMKKRDMDASIIPFLGSLINVAIKVMVLIAVAGMFGVETTSFIAVFGAMAFAIGMALQGSLGHFASGVLLLTFKPYKVGDLVKIGGADIGKVEEIQIFNTELVTAENRKIIVPNGLVTSNVIINITGQKIIGVDLVFGISYNDDIDRAKEIVLQVGQECPYILNDPEQFVGVKELADSSVNLLTRPFVKSEHFRDTQFYMYENVKKAFDQNGISIPFPQMDIHQKN